MLRLCARSRCFGDGVKPLKTRNADPVESATPTASPSALQVLGTVRLEGPGPPRVLTTSRQPLGRTLRGEQTAPPQ
eukprot:1264722-Prymnesium_polylepis.1